MRSPAQPSHPSQPPLRRGVLALLLCGLLAAHVLGTTAAGAQRLGPLTPAAKVIATTGAIDVGELPGSETISVTLRLAQSPAQTAALDQLLADQLDLSSPKYHHWLTPATFAAEFGATDAQIAILQSWLRTQGLTVGSISPSRTRVVVTGPAARAAAAFSVSLHRMSVSGEPHFANTADASLPAEIAPLIAGISGLDDLPSPAATRIHLVGGDPSLATAARVSSPAAPAADGRTLPGTAQGSPGTTEDLKTDAMSALAQAIDANGSAVLTLDSTACAEEIAASDTAIYRGLLRQANAQGITVLGTSACVATAHPANSAAAARPPAFPAAFGEITALTLAPSPDTAAASTGVELRPAWQAAPGLPRDSLRHEPDLTTSSAEAFSATVQMLVQQTGGRLGNVNAELYALAKTPGLYTQPDAAPLPATATAGAGNWEPATGLGLVDLVRLIKAFPRATAAPISTITGVQSSKYSVNYGDSFTLMAKVVPASYGTANPTGTVTFSASGQGTVGSATIDNNGSANLVPDVLPVGSYAISATYSGDGLYTGSTSTLSATVTISSVPARLIATVAPATMIPYGAAATVTATVTLPGANASPVGPVTAQISSGTPISAILSPNPGSNSATTNIDVSVPPPGNYNVHVTCQGTTNFQCQTPVNLPINVVKGYTTTQVSVTPAAPQAGQPISLTATVANSGNGTGSYTYGGSITFYDSGVRLATAPVATNQATTTVTLAGNRTHNITAVYTGDVNWNTSTANAVAVTPTILPDALTLGSNVSSGSSLAGVNIIFTATSTTTITYGIGPTGRISFYDTFNGAVVQLGNPATLVANGPTASVALFTTTGLLPGTHHIYAQYSGDDNYAASVSPVLVLSLSDFSVTMTPNSLNLAQGKSQQVTVFVGNSGGFNGAVSLGCTPPSGSEATCGFAPSALVGGGATTLTITTTAPKAAVRSTPSPRAGIWTAATGASLAGVAWLLLPSRRRRLPALLAVLFAVTLSANLGCGLGTTSTGGSGSGPAPGTPADSGTPLGTQNYIITAAGSDGVNTIRHTYQYQVTVQ